MPESSESRVCAPPPPPPRLLRRLPRLLLVHVRASAAAHPAATTTTTITATTPSPSLRCFLQSPTPPHTELLPALRLPDHHVDPDPNPSSPPSPLLHALLRAPFWLDLTLAFLGPEDWLRLEATCHRLARAVPYAAGAWRGLDLGPAWVGASARWKRREAIARRAAMGRVRRAWEGIEAFALPGLKWTLNPGLEEGEIRRLERELPTGCRLPADLRASFLVHNGQSFHADPGLCGGGRLLTLAEVTKELRRQHGQRPASPPPPPAPLAALEPQQQPTQPRRPLRMVPLSEGARGRSVCVALPYSREGRGAGDDGGGDVEGEGAIYVATALSCKRLADSWGSYLGTLR